MGHNDDDDDDAAEVSTKLRSLSFIVFDEYLSLLSLYARKPLQAVLREREHGFTMSA